LLIIPRTDGVSSSSTLWRIRRNPRPRTVARCDAFVPITLFTSVTLTVFPGFTFSVLATDGSSVLLAAVFAAVGSFGAAVSAADFAAGFFGVVFAVDSLVAGTFSTVLSSVVFFSAMLITPESLRPSCHASVRSRSASSSQQVRSALRARRCKDWSNQYTWQECQIHPSPRRSLALDRLR
jgi:hypothetical protein